MYVQQTTSCILNGIPYSCHQSWEKIWAMSSSFDYVVGGGHTSFHSIVGHRVDRPGDGEDDNFFSHLWYGISFTGGSQGACFKRRVRESYKLLPGLLSASPGSSSTVSTDISSEYQICRCSTVRMRMTGRFLKAMLPSLKISSVSDLSHFYVDPDPGIHIWEKCIWILGSTYRSENLFFIFFIFIKKSCRTNCNTYFCYRQKEKAFLR